MKENRARYSEGQASFSTADNCLSLTGVYTGINSLVNPVLRANFSFPFDYTPNSFVVPKEREKDFVQDAIKNLGKFKSIWVQGVPDFINTHGHSYWHPSLEEFIDTINRHLDIKS
jgi:hypothetical protein